MASASQRPVKPDVKIQNHKTPCLQCRLKSLDCDFARPCYHCVRRGEHSLCLWQETVCQPPYHGGRRGGESYERLIESNLDTQEKRDLASQLDNVRDVQNDKQNWALPNPFGERGPCHRLLTDDEVEARALLDVFDWDKEKARRMWVASEPGKWGKSKKCRTEDDGRGIE